MTDPPLYTQAVDRFMQRAPACAICGASDWEASYYALLTQNDKGIFQPLSRSYDGYAAFTCRDCQQTVFVRIGALQPTNPEPAE